MESAEEPVCDVHIFSPTDYVGAIMDLCQGGGGVSAICNIPPQTAWTFTTKCPLNGN